VRYRVQVGPTVRQEIERRYRAERTPEGGPSLADFEGGPLAAATFRFEHFDDLPEAMGPSVRQCHVLVPAFTPVVFIGVLVAPDVVEIAGFEDDPDYWDVIGNDPRP
jgi:hypothetical protein